MEVSENFVVIDTNQERLREAEEAGMFVLVGDAIEEQILDTAGVRCARLLATFRPIADLVLRAKANSRCFRITYSRFNSQEAPPC